MARMVGMSNWVALLFGFAWLGGSVLVYAGLVGPIPDMLIAATFSALWFATAGK